MNALGRIATRAGEQQLAFLLAGGHAVIAHGYLRNTFDLDLIICRDDRARWTELARELGYSLYHEGPTFLQFNSDSPEAPPLDLMLMNAATFAKLRAAAVPGPPSAAGAEVVSLRHLLALKCHSIKHGQPGRIVRDADDVIRLVQANAIDLNQPEVRDLFLKFGTAELYEKTRRACGQG